MHLSMWTYPWDIQDLSLDRTIADLRDKAGLNTISIATSYHAGRFLQPRSPHRKAYFPEDGTVYFYPDKDLWANKEIKPQVAENVTQGGDMLAALIEARQKTGMKVSCWTVCLHNTRLGMAHPDHVTRNAFGDPNYYNLCPSSPAARDYVKTLAEDISENYRPDMIELESPSFMGFAHGYHHEKDAVGLNAEDDFLLSLCFCPHCMKRAQAAGVDAHAARETVKHYITAMCEREIPEKQFPDFPAAGLAVFNEHKDLHDFLAWRSEPVTSLIAEIRQATHQDTKVVLIDLADGWLGGVDIEAAVQACDGIILCCYSQSVEEIATSFKQVKDIIEPNKFLGLGLRLFYPEFENGIVLAEHVKAAINAGACGVNFYNYGLIPEKRLDWVRMARDRITML